MTVERAEVALAKLPKRPRKTQAERRATAEKKLLAAALKLIAEKGVGRTTLAEIGEAAGYSRALPAVYFRDRDGLIRAVWDYVSSHFQKKMAATGERQAGLAAVLSVVDAYLTRSGSDPFVFRATQVLMIEAFTATPEIRENMAMYNREAEKFLRKHIRIGIERGEIRGDVDPKAQAILIMGALRGAVSHWIIDPAIDLGLVRKEFLQSLRRSLAP
jgi:AcrR family transcriptional regulator